MMLFRTLFQPIACSLGFHALPPQRVPPGPIVAACPCCSRVHYYYGLSVYGIGIYPSLLLPEFPRLLAALPPVRNA